MRASRRPRRLDPRAARYMSWPLQPPSSDCLPVSHFDALDEAAAVQLREHPGYLEVAEDVPAGAPLVDGLRDGPEPVRLLRGGESALLDLLCCGHLTPM